MLKSGPSASPPASDSPCGHCPGALGLSEPLFLGFRNEGRVLTLTPPPPPLHAFWPQDMCVCSTAKTTGHSPQALSSGPGPHPEAPIQAALSVCWWCWGRGGRVSTSGYWEGSLWTVGGPPPPGINQAGVGAGGWSSPCCGAAHRVGREDRERGDVPGARSHPGGSPQGAECSCQGHGGDLMFRWYLQFPGAQRLH